MKDSTVLPGSRLALSLEQAASDDERKALVRGIYRHRKQYGVNLGSLFALEPWLVPSLFIGIVSASSEMDLLSATSADSSNRLQKHWEQFVDDGDFQWMRGHGINTIRLPISYAAFAASQAPDLLRGTEYENFAQIYRTAWTSVDQIIRKAATHQIGVLIDLHCAPGGQNADGHSGLSGAPVAFWRGSRADWNRERTIEILSRIAERLSDTAYDNVIGLELLNEPKNDGRLQAWYERALDAIRKQNIDLPIYIGDAWDANHYSGWLAQRNDFVVLDHHCYRCFTDADHRTSAEQHASTMSHPHGHMHQALESWSSRAAGGKGGGIRGGNLIIGEWSAALNPRSFGGSDAPSATSKQTQWAQAQIQCYNRNTAGWYFWTLKKEGPPDAGWCLYSAVEAGVLPKVLSETRSAAPPSSTLQAAQERATSSHESYWSQHDRGVLSQSWRFKQGFRQGLVDAHTFWSFGRSAVGFRNQWCHARLLQHDHDNGKEHSWQFAHGMSQALDAFATV
ncbi:glycoside hydrolase [Ceraceosorus guamensis]|uniref:Glycoside hydrolase n=1 Tax=Ceraceosorus guamensis TaxID=1522189 RepID=A0A316W8G9_9BASI|nr:glycoside hydrolase [Ceraceosorus guamensis]PWN45051.1 glycoside hydrolase [Ceraceosorus guamensis]